MHTRRHVLAACLALAAPHASAAASDLAVSAVRIREGEPTPVIDGRVTEAAWTRVTPYGEFTQQDPDAGQPASQKTEVRILIDGANLYVGVICFDNDPAQIVFNQSRRDADLNETDSVQIILDTFHDRQNGFVFGTNPMGVQADGQVSGEGQTSGFQRNAGAFGAAGGGAQPCGRYATARGATARGDSTCSATSSGATNRRIWQQFRAATTCFGSRSPRRSRD